MRISDWSSDVCSSDLPVARADLGADVEIDEARSAGIIPRQHGAFARGFDQDRNPAVEIVDQQDAGGAVADRGDAAEQSGSDHRGLALAHAVARAGVRSDEHTSDIQSLSRIPYAVF